MCSKKKSKTLQPKDTGRKSHIGQLWTEGPLLAPKVSQVTRHSKLEACAGFGYLQDTVIVHTVVFDCLVLFSFPYTDATGHSLTYRLHIRSNRPLTQSSSAIFEAMTFPSQLWN